MLIISQEKTIALNYTCIRYLFYRQCEAENVDTGTTQKAYALLADIQGCEDPIILGLYENQDEVRSVFESLIRNITDGIENIFQVPESK